MQKVGVLRGGVGDEYYFSLESGTRIAEALRDEGYETIDMLIDREGVLHIKGVPADLESAQKSVDIIWSTLHGGWGEDGGLQRALGESDIPFVGSDTLASALAANKLSAKDRARALGINTPEAMLITPTGEESVSELTQAVYQRMAPPWVVKPLRGGGSSHTYFALTPLELAHFVEESISHGEPFIVEQYVYGKEAVVGVIDGFRGEELYTLPAVEVRSPRSGILTHDMRNQGEYVEESTHLSQREKDQLAIYARSIHRDIGARHYSQSDFIVDKYGKIWYIETDTAPHFGVQHSFVQGLKRVGASLRDFAKHIIGRK